MNEQSAEFKSARVNLLPYLAGLEQEIWCIVKLPTTFPELRRGGDLDLFCYDLARVAEKLLATMAEDIRETGFSIRISKKRPEHWHLDLMDGEEIECRFDLYGALPGYLRICVKSALFESIIEGAVSCEAAGCRYFIPAPVDDALIRYLEYCEYYWTGLDKIHHLDHIEALARQDDGLRPAFVDKLHHYTAFPDAAAQLAASPPTKWPKRPSLIGRYVAKLRNTPIHLWPVKVIWKVWLIAKKMGGKA